MAEWSSQGFGPLPRALSAFLGRLNGPSSGSLAMSVALVTDAVERGHTCLDLRAVGGRSLGEILGDDCPEGRQGELLPEAAAWEAALRSPEVTVLGRPGERAPLILDASGRLYLHRYWCYEQIVSRGIRERLASDGLPPDAPALREGIARLFGDSQERPDWQRVAAVTAAQHRFSVISGGPGTGKTYTLVRIIALLIEQGLRQGRKLSVALAAPTGKAAARLAEALRQAREALSATSEVKDQIPAEASTLHRLLGFRRPGRGSALLPVDLVVVDECSMVDVSLMARLLSALPPGCRLILAGDKDQLSSVEAGVVMGDICDTGREHGYSREAAGAVEAVCGEKLPEAALRDGEAPLASCISVLRRGRRMRGGIAPLAGAIGRGDAEGALACLSRDPGAEACLRSYQGVEELPALVREGVEPWFRAYLAAGSPEELFRVFGGRALLCALRRGKAGVEAANATIGALLWRSGSLPAEARAAGGPRGGLYPGLPLIVTVNDYSVGLYNGDIGIVAPPALRPPSAPGADGSSPVCLFPRPEGGYRTVSTARLPPHEPAFALTVHKSQGSEFDEVTLLLPPGPSPVLCRELLYTAVTRARKRVTILGSEETVRWMVEHPTRRSSGLRDLLWQA